MQQKGPEKVTETTETSSEQIRQSGCATQAHNLLKSLQEMGKKTEFKYLVHEGRTYLQEMGEKDEEQNPTPAGIYTKESVGKVT